MKSVGRKKASVVCCSEDMAGTQTSHFRSRHGHRACSLQDYAARNRLGLAYFVAIFNDLWDGISSIALWCVLALTVERETLRHHHALFWSCQSNGHTLFTSHDAFTPWSSFSS